jgi:hypothetical protein
MAKGKTSTVETSDEDKAENIPITAHVTPEQHKAIEEPMGASLRTQAEAVRQLIEAGLNAVGK